jgi:predicted  nucleic acid-binding Zn-ribbon protein
MREPRPNTKCRRCGRAYRDHRANGSACPDGSGRVYQRHTERRAVLRFNAPELKTLHVVLRNAAHAGGNARELPVLLGKVERAGQRLERTRVSHEHREAKAS